MRKAGGLIASPVALALLASACTVGPRYRPPAPGSLGVPDAFAAASPAFAAPADAAELARWWTGLGDPVLDALIGEALARGPDIVAAGARLREARGSLRTARATLFPSLSGSASAGHTTLLGKGGDVLIAPPGSGLGAGGTGGAATFSTGGSSTNISAGLDASYEVDLFGGVRRGVEAARGDEAAALEALRDTQRTIAAEVALDYITARAAQERLAIARANLASEDETVAIVGWRVQAGLVSALDLARARAQREQTAATIPSLETSLVEAGSALAILCGLTPETVRARLAAAAPIPPADRMLGADVPLAMLERRPDVRAAERQLAAASARIGVARAALYPALRLSGTLVGNGGSIGDLTRFATGTLLANLTAPIFDGGAIRGRIETARGAADEALATYRKTVLTALGDVENAMTALANSHERAVSLSLAADQSQQALLLAQSQYRAGLVDFQTLLDSQRTLLGTQDAAASTRADRATALVQLYKALGGGWQAAPMPVSALPLTPAAIELPDLAAPAPAAPANPQGQ
ncbi:efflux transporter outer membrane subunit [Sphingomonas morindae]|uniref:Efflux transporter outer membrane subunit n=1 Tax=Sphingomonas morindae TaxID=1541170 RepID=A0ABY4XB99_9SPHN|nr:efflux transporter outer membrane subunit [Sphingomonas morindae]USI74182.1 efflux transporter outer membrane subunit [Sphingomonas morindae]